jgi:hypothetical protein
VLFAFRHSQQYNTAAPTIRLRGLDERAIYKRGIGQRETGGAPPQLSGAYLMRAGLNVNLRGDFDDLAGSANGSAERTGQIARIHRISIVDPPPLRSPHRSVSIASRFPSRRR